MRVSSDLAFIHSVMGVMRYTSDEGIRGYTTIERGIRGCKASERDVKLCTTSYRGM